MKQSFVMLSRKTKICTPKENDFLNRELKISLRHCKQSEAIHSKGHINWIASFLAMTKQTF